MGWRAVAANLSDLAASGAVDIDGITVALVAPGHTRWDWVDGVYQGITAALEQYGGVLLGGDCSKGEQRLLSITALGRLGPLRLHRNAARPGDVLVTSGPHGLSRLGLALLQNDPNVRDIALCSTLRDQAITRHQRPTPRLKDVQQLLARLCVQQLQKDRVGLERTEVAEPHVSVCPIEPTCDILLDRKL